MHHGKLTPKIANGIKRIRELIEAAEIPPSILDKKITIATWNIRAFGSATRTPAAIHYIAEILSQFNLIAITELRDNLADLERVMDILGPYWRVVHSDYRKDSAGNSERIGFLYDKRAVVFTGLAAEAEPPKKKNRKTGVWEDLHADWWRSPYMASFRAGNFDFVILAVHIRWGGSEAARKPALENLAEWVHKRRKDKFVKDKDIILLGDFNIPKVDSDLFRAITKKGLRSPAALLGVKSNLSRTATYDQMFHSPTKVKRFTDKGGVVVFEKGDHEVLFGPTVKKSRFTYQMSDHLPLWLELDVWIEDEQIKAAIPRERGR